MGVEGIGGYLRVFECVSERTPDVVAVEVPAGGGGGGGGPDTPMFRGESLFPRAVLLW